MVVVHAAHCLGAVTAFLALAVIGLGADDASTEGAMSRAPDPLARRVVFPLRFVTLAIGIVESLGTP